MRRGPEKPETLFGKKNLAALFTRRGFKTLFEHRFADVLAYRVKDRKLRIVAGESDTEIKTSVPNVLRDIRNGADAIVIHTPSEALRAAIRRKLKRDLPRAIWTRVGIITKAGCLALFDRVGSDSLHQVGSALPEKNKSGLISTPLNPNQKQGSYANKQ